MSIPANSTVIPALRYRDAPAAIDWLCAALGFTRNAVYDGPDNTIAHAQLIFGSGMIMLGSASNGGPFASHLTLPSEIDLRETQMSTLITSDATALYKQATGAGAVVVMELSDMPYGGKAFAVRDPEGHLWSVGEYDPWAAHTG